MFARLVLVAFASVRERLKIKSKLIQLVQRLNKCCKCARCRCGCLFLCSPCHFIYTVSERERERRKKRDRETFCASLECVTNFVSIEKQQQHFKRYLSLFLSACFSVSLSHTVCPSPCVFSTCLLFAKRNDIYIAGHSYRLSCFVSHTLSENVRLANGAYAWYSTAIASLPLGLSII